MVKNTGLQSRLGFDAGSASLSRGGTLDDNIPLTVVGHPQV